MSMTIRALASLAALGAVACFSVASFAEPSPAGAASPGMEAREHWVEHRREQGEVRAKALHDILRLRPDQENAFQAFLAAMKPPERARDAERAPDKPPAAALTTPERLDFMAQRLAEHQAQFKRRADAVKAFYGVLSPEQRRAFDALAALRFDRGRGAEGGMRQHRFPGMPG